MRRYSPRVEGLRLARTIAWRGRVTLLTGSSRRSSRPQQERGRTRGQSWQQAAVGRLEGTRQAKGTAIEENTKTRPTATRRQRATVTHARRRAEPMAEPGASMSSRNTAETWYQDCHPVVVGRSAVTLGPGPGRWSCKRHHNDLTAALMAAPKGGNCTYDTDGEVQCA